MKSFVAALAALAVLPAIAAAGTGRVAVFGCNDQNYSVTREASADRVFVLRRIENGGRRVLVLEVPDSAAATPEGLCAEVAEVCGAERVTPVFFDPSAPACVAGGVN